MKKSTKIIIASVVIGLLGIAFLFIRRLVVQPDISLNKMKIEDLNGKQADITGMVGKPIVINYWATWCVPCLKEFPEFETIKKQFEDKVTFLMISDEPTQTIQNFKDKKSYTFNYYRAISGFEDVMVRPVTFIYDKKGALVSKHAGTLNASELTEILKKID